jgi:CheY-like chemotaxis protein
MADVGQIEQIIMNLAVNAADAMPHGGELTIETALSVLDGEYPGIPLDVAPGLYVMLAVSDTGHGMDKETRDHIFEPFFSTKGPQGTGLGLATIFGIVKQHGGNIRLYSEPNKGTTFKIYLPVAEETPVEAENSGITTDLACTETILLVEDSEQVRHLTRTVLKQQGYTVIMAENGEKALKALAAHKGPVHLLLTDVVMPGLNGKELYERVVREKSGMKVLYMSGYTNDIIFSRGLLDEGVNFIQKPFTKKELTARIREILDQG